MAPSQNLVVVVPTIRPRRLRHFLRVWRHELRGATILIVQDGRHPLVYHNEKQPDDPLRGRAWPLDKVCQGKEKALIFNFNDGVRNLGFVYAAKRTDAWNILTLDDDVEPSRLIRPSLTPGLCAAAHCAVLGTCVPISWLSTASAFMRGFPYGLREEATVWASHGVWEHNLDYDAPTQLVRGSQAAYFYRGPIPRGVYAPICGMNFAFTREALPHVYFAPMGPKCGIDRFADIWMGICLKRASDLSNRAIVSGYATCWHTRASDVYTNLAKEAPGLRWNEEFWHKEPNTPYFRMYRDLRKRWFDLLAPLS